MGIAKFGRKSPCPHTARVWKRCRSALNSDTNAYCNPKRRGKVLHEHMEEAFPGLGFDPFDNSPQGHIFHKRRLFVPCVLHTLIT
jgi:hypothetical protein